MSNGTVRKKPLLTSAAVVAALTLTACGGQPASEAPAESPNIVIILADDLGYGDLGSYGHPTIRTPRLDQLAAEGQRWTNFYAGAGVCSPSRASLLTGRLPIRNGVQPVSRSRRVFFPDSYGGLPHEEVTIAEVLKQKGYASAAIGKWHLGHLPEYLPMAQGFDSYFGIPYSNDMNAVGGWRLETFFAEPNIENWDVPLMQNEEEIERPANQTTITKRYTERAVEFIRANAGGSFFLYLAHTMPHVPLFVSEEAMGKSARGFYGDVIQEIDWSVGQVVDALKDVGIERNTLVVFTSDNGPWLKMLQHSGSSGLLRDGKATTYEGGMRVPAIFWMPGTVTPGVVEGLGASIDLLPTVAAMTETGTPDGVLLDGVDLTPTLTNGAPSPRDEMIFYRRDELYAIRKGPYKAHFITETSYVDDTMRTLHDPPLLFNVDEDPSEAYDIAEAHPEVIEEILVIAREHDQGVDQREPELEKYPRQDEGVAEKPSTHRPWLQ